MTRPQTPQKTPAVPPPPRNWLLAYRLLGLRLPPEHSKWVVQDTASKAFLAWRSLRSFLWAEVFFGLLVLGYQAGRGDTLATRRLIQGQLVVLAVVLLSSRDTLVRRTLRWHRIDKRGNPSSKVRTFARLANPEVALLGAAALIAWTAGTVVAGDMNRPTGVRAAPCREADPNVLDQITARKIAPNAVYTKTRMVRYDDTFVVIAETDLDGDLTPKPKPSPLPTPTASGAPVLLDDKVLEIWIVNDKGIQQFDVRTPTSTDYPKVTIADRGLVDAVGRVSECRGKDPIR